MTAKPSSDPAPRNTSRTAQKIRKNLQNCVHISARTVQT